MLRIMNKKKLLKILTITGILLVFLVAAGEVHMVVGDVYAGASCESDPENAGNSSGSSTSPGFQIDSQVGDVAVGTSNSTNFELDHGFFYPDDEIVYLTFLLAPEKRVPDPPNMDPPPNWDVSDVRVQIRDIGDGTVLFEGVVGPTSTDGEYLIPVSTTVAAGMYDVAMKGISHLTQLRVSVTLIDGVNYIDMSGGGTVFMLAGDVNLAFGDDKVNSLDIGTVVPLLNSSVYRTDLNQDTKVNSLDMGILVANLNKVGE